MSIQVESFDDRKAEEVVKTCPKIVQDYIKLLKQSKDRWEDLTQKAIKKLKEQNKEL